VYDSSYDESCLKTGISREQPSFLPPRVEDYVDCSNPVRAIDAFVDALNLHKLGFRRLGPLVGRASHPMTPPTF
jgi:hypothetical protein